jgi:hypothetical protein
VPLVEGSELGGLVWLEGSPAGGMGVRAAAWEDGRWAQADWIARPGKGSQTGLAGVVLRDGSWLVVWSAFDGQDDEIVSARRAGDGWQAPRRVVADNRVPDITPALAVTNQGAIAAWSRFDGTGLQPGARALERGRLARAGGPGA